MVKREQGEMVESALAADLVVAVDLGGTWIRVALYDGEHQALERQAEPTHAEEGPESVIRRMIEAVHRVGAAAGWEQIAGIGVSSPGPLDPGRGVVLWTPNLPGWKNEPLAKQLSKATQRPVFLGNDADLAALAEHRYGAGQGYPDLIYITVSTGIGGGILVGGQLVLGQDGLAGEVGHMVLEPNGPLCNCGRTGCLEALASGTGIARAAREAVLAGRPTRITHLVNGDLKRITARVVHQAAQEGDDVAATVFRGAGRYLGIGIANLMCLLNPAVVIIGGSVANAGDLLWNAMEATHREQLDEVYWCPVVPAVLGDDVSLIGAAILAREGLQNLLEGAQHG
jgi:glucokinase